MSKLIDFKIYRDIKGLQKDVNDKTQICKILKDTIKNLTNYEQYSSIKHTINDLHVLYLDAKRSRLKSIEHIERLKNEQERMDSSRNRETDGSEA